MFSKWLENKEKSNKSKCPVCGEMRSKLADHVIRKHKMDKTTAKALRSQTRQNHVTRKAKRVHKPYICPLKMCAKIVKRPHNHLKDTHKIKDNRLYRKLLDKMVPFETVSDVTESEESDTEFESDEEDREEYRLVEKIMRKSDTGYFKKNEHDPVNSEDSEDDDWLEKKVQEVRQKETGVCCYAICVVFLSV